MTDRDLKILELLTTVRYATTKQIKDTIFANVSPSICYKRLSYLVNNKMIYRKYFNLGKNTNCYVYYLDKAPRKKNLEHELLVSQFIVELTKSDISILEVNKSPIYKGIKPDLIARIRTKAGRNRVVFLEVQLSKHDCVSKYFNLYEGDTPAILYIVTDNKIEPKQIRGMRVVIDNTSFKKLSFYFS